MCGYFGFRKRGGATSTVLDALGLSEYVEGPRLLRRVIPGLITHENGNYQQSKAMWWFAHEKNSDGMYEPNFKYTTFNARNVDSNFWKPHLNQRRGIFLASEIGESQGAVSNAKKYLMTSERGLILGAIYNDWHNEDGSVQRSVAVITRDPHKRFSQYHDKSIPCFLPADLDVIKHWLDPTINANDALIQSLLDQPTITEDLSVQQVKTYSKAEALGDPERLKKDSS